MVIILDNDLFLLLQGELDTDSTTKRISRQLQDELASKLKPIGLSFEIKGLDDELKGMFKVVDSEVDKTKKRTEQSFKDMGNAMKSGMDFSSILDTKNFNDFEKEIEKVKKNVKSLNQVKVKIDGDNQIDETIIKYTDNTGKAVTETLKFREVVDVASKQISTSWESTGMVIEDNIKKTRDLESAIETFKSNMGSKIEVLEGTKIVDEDRLEKLKKSISGLSIETDDVKNVMKELSGEFVNLNRESESISASVLNSAKAMSDFEKQLREVSNAKKLDTITTQEYIDTMSKMVFDEGGKGGFSDGFNAMSAQSQIQLYNELKRAVNEQDKAWNNVYNTKKRIETLEQKELENAEKMKHNLQEFKKMQSSRVELLGKNTDADTKKIETLQKRISELSATTPNLKGEMKSLANDITLLGRESEKTGNSFSLLTRYFGAHEVINLTKRAVRSMITEVYELDKALIELKKTTGMSSGELKSFSQEAYDIAGELGRSGTEMTMAVADFRRAGYDLQDATTMATNAMLTLNIGDGVDSVKQSADGLISVTKALGISAQDSIKMLDSVNNVANNTSISFDALYEILTRSTGVLAQTGNDIHEIIAMANAGFATLRDAGQVATGLNAISTRLLAVKEGAEEADGEIVANLEPTLKRIANVEIIDEKGLRSVYDVLNDLAQVFPTLSREHQQLIATEIGGRQQIKTITALLQNWEEAEKALEFSINSTGSAMEEQANYSEGLEAKLNNLKTAWASLSKTTLNSNFVKGIVDATTALVKFMDKAGGLVPIIAGVGVAVVMFTIQIKGLTSSLIKMAAATAGAEVAMVGLSLLTPIGWGLLAATSIAGVAAAIKKATGAAEEARQEVVELTKELDDLKTTQENMIPIAERFEELREKQKTSELDVEEEQEYVRLQNELKEIMPEINGYWDEKGNFIIAANESLSTMNATMRESIQLQRQEVAKAAKIDASNRIKEYEKTSEKIKELTKEINYLEDRFEKEQNAIDEITLESLRKDLEKTKRAYGQATDDIHDSIIGIISATAEWDKMVHEQANGEVKANAIRKTLANEDEKIRVEWLRGLNDGTLATEVLIRILSKMPETIAEIEKNTKSAGQAAKEAREAAKAAELQEELEGVSDALERMQSSSRGAVSDLQELQSAMDAVREGNTLTANTMQSLLEKYPELHDAVIETSDGFQINVEALEAVQQATLDNEMVTLNAEIARTENVLKGTIERIGMRMEEVKSIQSLADAEAKAAKVRGSAANSIFGTGYRPVSYRDTLSEEEQQIVDVMKTYGSLQDQKRALEISAKAVFSGSGKNKKNSASKSKAKKESRLPKYISQGFDAAIHEIETQSAKLERVIDRTQKKILNAQKMGNVEEELELQKQLEEMYAQRLKLEEKTSAELISYRDKLAKDLAGKQLKELSGVNLQSITPRQLDEINRKLDAQIDKAQIASNNKLSQTLSNRKEMINEYANAIMAANDKVNGIATSWWDIDNNRIQQSIDLMERRFELQEKLAEEKLKNLDAQMLLAKQNSEWALALEKEMYDEILYEQKRIMNMIYELKQFGLTQDQEIVEKYYEMWRDAEVRRINMLKEMGERARQERLNELKKEQDELNKSKDAMQKLLDMTMSMIRQRYEEERKLIQEQLTQKENAIRKEQDGYREIIELRKKALRDEKDEKDYDKELKARQKKVSDIEAKLLAIQNDSSQKAKAQRLKLENEKDTYIKELEEFQYDRSIELQEKALDEELERYEKQKDEELEKYQDQKNKELKILDDHLSKEGNLRAEAIKLIESNNRNLYRQLLRWNTEYGTGIRDDVTNAWDVAHDAMDKYNDGHYNIIDALDIIIAKTREIGMITVDTNNSSWQDYTEPDLIKPESSKPMDFDDVGKAEHKAKVAMQLNELGYLHSIAKKAKAENDKDAIAWVEKERKKWGLDPTTGGVIKGKEGTVPEDFWNKNKHKYGFYRGGETTKTGFIQVDGTPNKPERVLSPEQTEAFNKLVEYLPNIIHRIDPRDTNGEVQGAVKLHFDNMINVEGNLDESVDIEQIIDMATKEVMAVLHSALKGKGIKRKPKALANG